MGKITKLSYEQRHSVILSTAIIIANRDGLVKVTHEAVANEAYVQTSTGTVKFYFRRRADLWRAIAMHGDASQLVRNEALALGVL